MKGFARVNDLYGNALILNLRYVTKIRPGTPRNRPTEVIFENGESLQLTATEGARLIGQLNRCCDRKCAGRGQEQKGRRKLTMRRALKQLR